MSELLAFFVGWFAMMFLWYKTEDKVYTAVYHRGYKKGRADAPMKRAMGRWILVDDDGKHVCDQCHHYAPSFTKGCSWMSNNGEWLSGFCPNCGADMVESEGEHDESV